jgi:uncharacterized protein
LQQASEERFMKEIAAFKGRYALITGGCSGIGAAIAEELAKAGVNLVLVARDEERLQEIAERLSQTYGGNVQTIAVNLGETGVPPRLVAQIEAWQIEIELLVNAAGLSHRALVSDTDPSALRGLIDANVGALTELTALYVSKMVGRGHGAIINIASTGGYMPVPYLAAYAASKAYVLSFTEALWAETGGTGVRVVAVSPGRTRTPMTKGEGSRHPDDVARTALRALGGTEPSVIDGMTNALSTWLIRRLPRKPVTRFVLRTMRRQKAP